ncbi:ABC transporter permease [Bacteroidales bacterium OttesenSCG-928-M11]|nr:ABC transporter permease [Bacteroidales bacterium OttesenSCG-928-M11]
MKTIDYIKKAIGDMFRIWHDELKQVFSDVGVIIFFLIVPLAYPVIYGLIYTTETIREVPMVVVDDSHSSLARAFVRKVDGTPDALIYSYVTNIDEAKALVDSKKAYGVLYFPADFSQKINRGEQSTVSLFLDMSGLLYYKALLLAVTEVSMDMGATINPTRIDTGAPINYESVSLYNPQNGFASFLVPGIVVLAIQQTLLLGIGMLAATTREKNPSGRLIPPHSSYRGTLRIVLGKALCYFAIYIFVSIWALEIVPRIFNLPQIGSTGTLLLFKLPYLLACIFLSMMVSTFIRGRETPMMILVFTSLPLLFLSGISWPLASIPDFWKYISYIFPSSFGIQGYVKLNSMSAGLSEIAFEYQALWIQTGIYFIITYLIYRKESIRKD